MEPFIYLPSYRVIICTDPLCRYAVLPGHIDRHLLKRHRVTAGKRRDIVNKIMAIPDLFVNEEHLEFAFQNPQPNQPAIPDLPVYTDGWACSYTPCQYVCRGKTGIIRHCETVHGWVNPYKRGRAARSHQIRDYPWQTGVHCQRIFTQGVPQEYFQVNPLSGSSPDQTPSAQATPQSSMPEKCQKELERIRVKQEAIASQDAVAQPEQMSDTNPWLERVEWAHHLAGYPFEEMIQWAELPRDDEITLQRICDGFTRMIDIAQQLILSQRCTFFARVEINRKEKEKTPQRPFQARMGDDTKKRYGEVWQRMICYIYRTHQMENRPPYQLTPSQVIELEGLIHLAQEADDDEAIGSDIEDERDENDDNDSGYNEPQGPPESTPIQRQCLRFCISLLDHQVHSGHYHNAVVSALAVLGIDTENSTWLPAENYTPKLSAVIKLARMMVVLETYDSVPNPEETAIVKLVGQKVERYMMMTKPTPMKWIFMTRTYGMKIRYSTTAPGTVQWHRGNRVQYRGTVVSVGQLQSWVHGLGEECRRLMAQELLLFGADDGEAIPPIPWDTLCDNPSIHQPGYNFIHDERNSFPVDGSRWLFERVMNRDDIRAEFVPDRDPDDPLVWKRARISQYMKAIRRMKEKLAVFIQLSAGQPARAPELLSIRYQNTRNGGRRNIFIEDGKVVFVAAYHKGYNLGGNTKIIHRYLPEEVGEMVVRYLWLVEPFQRQLEVAVEGQSLGRGYLWERGMDDRKWTSDRIGRLMEQESQIGMGVKVGISIYRQIAIAIARHCLKGEGFVDDRDDEEGLEDGEEEGSNGPDHILDLQAGHGSHVAGMIYARAILEAPGEVASIRQQYRKASEAWHRLLQFPSTLGVLVRKRAWETEEQDRALAKWKRMRTFNVYGPLERIVGAGAQFRGIQEPVIKAIMRGESPIVSVMGTGAGKSLLFMLPAMCSAMDTHSGTPGMTVVVIPMISLRQDIQRRCQAVGLTCAEWNYRHPPAGVSIMLVTSESAVSHAFQAFLLRIRASHHLERIVIDECHTVLDSREDFRPKLQRLSELWTAECPIVMLTATLPPEDEARFGQMMKIPREIIQWYRAPTSRPNIGYRVVPQDGQDDEAVQGVITELRQRYPEGKFIIYSTRIARVKALATAFDCEAYYRNVGDKKDAFHRIIQPDCPIVVATNALGLGIDMPNIRAVIHVDGPRSIRDFGQESGRAGRDGQISESVIMVSPDSEPSDTRMAQLMQGQTCCRVILDGYLDGREDRQQCEADEQACYVCRPSTPEPEEAPSVEEMEAHEEFEFQARQREQLQTWVQRMRSNEALAVDVFTQQLDEWAHRCPWCYTHGRVGARTEHPLDQCPATDVDDVRRAYQQMTKGIRYEKYCVCYECGVPQAICDRFAASEDGGWKWERQRGCQYAGVTVGAVISMMTANINGRGDAIGEWMRLEGVDERRSGEVFQWMGRKIRWGGMEVAIINKVFYRLAVASG